MCQSNSTDSKVLTVHVADLVSHLDNLYGPLNSIQNDSWVQIQDKPLEHGQMWTQNKIKEKELALHVVNPNWIRDHAYDFLSKTGCSSNLTSLLTLLQYWTSPTLASQKEVITSFKMIRDSTPCFLLRAYRKNNDIQWKIAKAYISGEYFNKLTLSCTKCTF